MNYKVYTFTLTQPSGDNPVVSVLESQLCGTVEWTANGNGTVIGTLVGVFPLGKTKFLFTTDLNNGPAFISAGRESDDSVSVTGMNISGTPSDGLFNDTLVEIRIYY